MNPSEINTDLIKLNFDLEKATNYFHSNPSKNKVISCVRFGLRPTLLRNHKTIR